MKTTTTRARREFRLDWVSVPETPDRFGYWTGLRRGLEVVRIICRPEDHLIIVRRVKGPSLHVVVPRSSLDALGPRLREVQTIAHTLAANNGFIQSARTKDLKT